MGGILIEEKTRYFKDLKAILGSIYGIIVCGFLYFCCNSYKKITILAKNLYI